MLKRKLLEAVTKFKWRNVSVAEGTGTYSKPPNAHIELMAAKIGVSILDAWIECRDCNHRSRTRTDMIAHIQEYHPGHEFANALLQEEIEEFGDRL